MKILDNQKTRYGLYTYFVYAIIVLSFILMLILYLYQGYQVNQNIKKTGYSILNSLVTDTTHSLQKGERNSFQNALDQVVTLQNVQSVSLYARNNLMTYKSGELSVGLPFLKNKDKLINPNEKLYIQTNGSYIRDDWSFKDSDMKNHDLTVQTNKVFQNIKSKKCSACHYELNQNLHFDSENKAHSVDKDKSKFYYQIPVEPRCIGCHTHWKLGESAGYLNVQMDNTKVILQSQERFKYFFFILATIIVLFLIIGYFITKINKQLNATQIQLKEQVNHDSMTGLHNRRYLYQISDNLINLSKRENQDMYLIMFDIDNFKSINDTYGHDVGDKVIVSLSKEVLKSIRKSDIAARWGGEEFLVLLPHTNQHGAMVLAEKIRLAIEKLHLDEVDFTVSVGVANFDYAEDNDIDDAIKKADEALYEAKNSGKNKVCLYI